MQEFLMKLTKKQKIILGVIAGVIVVIVGIFAYKYFYIDNGPENVIETSKSQETQGNEANENSSTDEDEEDTETSDGIFTTKSKKTSIMVHIIGEVNKPGVVKLKEGARIVDAIEAAGGQTENADLTMVNLAYVLEDGTQIYIPKYGDNLEDISLVREDAGEGVIKESAVNDGKTGENTKVNINTATKEKLTTLPRNRWCNGRKNNRIQNPKWKIFYPRGHKKGQRHRGQQVQQYQR